ncbi:85/88 kDa calcium-independent phospholipase A2-like isoform X1 [Daphnia pulex]|uniref:85/88 kDa calcium-independent phospholipase A2-like isoform X1 n=2 Tax=Daphnia pulex TaxID=6669 RepID=UPI001EE0F82C|nr:85/88 kDa calcium-independent phospholipase A2-like isoform X1 [Daphnia pulex]
MSFFSQLASAVATNLVNSLTSSGITDPVKVTEVSSSSLITRNVCKRDQCLVLYGKGASVNAAGFELIMTGSRDKLFSLCRSSEETFVEHHFQMARDKLPYLLKISVELCMLPQLQEVWSLIIVNPCWTAAHIVAYYGLQDGLKDPSLSALLCLCDESTGMTPMHVAAKSGKAEFVKAVISSTMSENVQFDARDHKGNTVYHYAATANKETIEALGFCPLQGMINSKNEENQTPLHLACLADKPDNVKALIAAGANVNASSNDEGSIVQTAVATSFACAKEILTAFPNQLHVKDMKNGGTPLHWATTKEVVIALVELGCSIDARNFSGHTALHVMVQRDRFECVVALLSCGADPNLVDSTGNSPLHLASSSASLLIVQALIAFGSNVNMLNDQGESPRHLVAGMRSNTAPQLLYCVHAVGAKRCSQKMPKCGDGCSPTGKDDGQSSGVDQIPRTRYLFDAMLHQVCQHSASANQGSKSSIGGRILCLDGGGIRGLILIQMLEALETILGGPVIKHFDWISGTSTGGILALALCCGKSIYECKSMYFRFKDQVFIGKRPYNADHLEGFLRTEFGDRTMADITGPKLMVTAVIADTIPADLHIFRNYTSPQDLLSIPEVNKSKKAEDQMVWQAARASGAAPTYFRAFGSFLDGGLIANNPTLDVLTEIQEYNSVMNALGAGSSVQPMLVVSFGTGCKPTEQVNTIDVFRPESLIDAARLAWGASAFGKLLVEQVTSTDRRVVDRARSWCSMIGCAYFRLSPCLEKDIALDETRNDQLIPMLWETKAFIHSHSADFKRIAQLLKN